MACEFEVIFSAERYPDATPAASDALDRVDQLEDLLSIYRPESPICQVNRRAALEPVAVRQELYEVLSIAQRIAHQTSGAFDPTCGPLSAAWGFLKRSGHIPSDELLAAALRRVGYLKLQLDPETQTVRFLAHDLEINVNAVGKGYALDRAAELLASRSIEHFLLHGGQSSVLARGSGPDTGTGWIVGLRHPERPGTRIAEFLLVDQALGTSGSATQSFHAHGRRFGHVLDPRTGRPAEGVLSATVVAPTAAEADALSTAFYVMGPVEALKYCRGRREIGMLMVCPTGRSGGIQLFSENLAGNPLACPPRIDRTVSQVPCTSRDLSS
jgi:thiamine biosynthesis lipoprotein